MFSWCSRGRSRAGGFCGLIAAITRCAKSIWSGSKYRITKIYPFGKTITTTKRPDTQISPPAPEDQEAPAGSLRSARTARPHPTGKCRCPPLCPRPRRPPPSRRVGRLLGGNQPLILHLGLLHAFPYAPGIFLQGTGLCAEKRFDAAAELFKL